jgi:hypothetical protein
MGHTKHHMKHKHHRAKGGRVVYEGKDSHVAHEAEEKKHGGAVHHVHGHKGKHRIKKKHGGAVGSDMHPFSSAGRHGMTNSPAKHHGGHTSGFVAGHGKG